MPARFCGSWDYNCVFIVIKSSDIYTYNGEKDVSWLAHSILNISSSNLQVTRTCIKSRTRSIWGLLALERRNVFSILIMEYCCQQDRVFTFNPIIFKPENNRGSHRISDEFEFRPHRIGFTL